MAVRRRERCDRVGALGGEGRAVWAVRLASSLVFVVVVVVLMFDVLGRD